MKKSKNPVGKDLFYSVSYMINCKTWYNGHVFFEFWKRGWKNKKKEFMGEKRCL